MIWIAQMHQMIFTILLRKFSRRIFSVLVLVIWACRPNQAIQQDKQSLHGSWLLKIYMDSVMVTHSPFKSHHLLNGITEIRYDGETLLLEADGRSLVFLKNSSNPNAGIAFFVNREIFAGSYMLFDSLGNSTNKVVRLSADGDIL